MPDANLKGYRLTPAAQVDLDDIWETTVAQWSVDQAEAYLRGLWKTLDVLIFQPKIARERHEIVPPVRLHPYRSHVIIYRIEGDFIEVVRLVHHRRNWIALLGE